MNNRYQDLAETARYAALEYLEQDPKLTAEEAAENDHEFADGLDVVIYSYKARELVNETPSEEEGQAWDELKDCGMAADLDDLDDACTKLAYFIARRLFLEAVSEVFICDTCNDALEADDYEVDTDSNPAVAICADCALEAEEAEEVTV